MAYTGRKVIAGPIILIITINAINHLLILGKLYVPYGYGNTVTPSQMLFSLLLFPALATVFYRWSRGAKFFGYHPWRFWAGGLPR